MQGRFGDGVTHPPDSARQRSHDPCGYGRPTGGDNLEVAPIETAHLLSRDDIDGVDGIGPHELLTRTGTTPDFVVHKDLRDHGSYLSPTCEDRPGVTGAADTDFLVYPCKESPRDDEVEHRVHVVGEHESIPAPSLGGVVLAIAGEDSDLAYFDAEGDDPEGVAAEDLPVDFDAELLSDHTLAWDGVDRLYQCGFFGQRLYDRDANSDPLQLSLLGAAYLTHVDMPVIGKADVASRGRDTESDRFDRRLTAYAAPREARTVPRSGFKFGSDFRVCTESESVGNLSHSKFLVCVVASDHTLVPRGLSLNVCLAGGICKRMVLALTGNNGEIDWFSVSRLTP